MNFELFDIVRESCSTRTWSKGVELARRDAVTGDRRSKEEVALRVAEREKGISRSVSLWPEDGDWACDCGGEDPCEHIAAAVIALKRAMEKGEDLPTSKTASGRIVYRLTAVEGELHLKRCIRVGDDEEPLVRPLGALAQGEGNVAATQDDWNLEIALGHERFGEVPSRLWPRLIPILRLMEDIRFEGQSTQVHADPLGWEATVRNDETGIRVKLGPASAIEKVFKNGIALTREGFHPYHEPILPRSLQALRDGVWFGPRDFAMVASELLPELEKHVPVRLHTARLPGRTRLAPQGRLTLSIKDGVLRARADLVYGEPPLARLEGDRLIALSDRMPERDREAESKVIRRLGQCAGLAPGEERSLGFAEAVAIKEAIRDLQVDGNALPWLRDRGSLGAEPWLEGGTLGVRVSHGGGGISFVPFDSFKETDGLMSLGDQGFGRIPPERWRELYPILQELQAARSKPDHAPSRLLLATSLPKEAVASFPDLARLANWDEDPASLAAFQGTLRDYQRTGARWLDRHARFSGGALLADDMGLGKTVQVAAVLAPGSLIVCPASLIFNWEAELKRFRPDLSVQRYTGAGRSLTHPSDVVLTTYGTLRVDAETLAARAWACVVLDESQAIKNAQSQTAQAAFSLNAKSRFALTGTPIENALTDLWSQFQFLLPGYLGDEASFRSRYLGGAPDAALQALRAKTRPFILRRLKSDVAPELPPRLEVLLPVEPSAEEKTFYEALHLATRADLMEKAGEEMSVMALLEAILRLRQAATAPELVPGAPRGIGSTKLDLLVEKLSEALASGHKALVFSQWTSCLDLIASRLEAAGQSFLRLDGTTRDRASVVQGFQNDQAPVLLMSLKAGGVGLTLTAADHVFIVDPWWNPAAEDQAADRAHRIGQTKTVLIHRLISTGTLEEKILKLQQSKRALATSLVEGAGAPITRTELLELLGD